MPHLAMRLLSGSIKSKPFVAYQIRSERNVLFFFFFYTKLPSLFFQWQNIAVCLCQNHTKLKTLRQCEKNDPDVQMLNSKLNASKHSTPSKLYCNRVYPIGSASMPPNNICYAIIFVTKCYEERIK